MNFLVYALGALTIYCTAFSAYMLYTDKAIRKRMIKFVILFAEILIIAAVCFINRTFVREVNWERLLVLTCLLIMYCTFSSFYVLESSRKLRRRFFRFLGLLFGVSIIPVVMVSCFLSTAKEDLGYYLILLSGLAIYCTLFTTYMFDMNKKLRKNFLRAVLLLVEAAAAPLVILLGYIVPKKRDLVLLMGRFQSGFRDNLKYLLIYLKDHQIDKKYDIYYMGHREEKIGELKDCEIQCANFPSMKTYWLLLRAGLIITDNTHWGTRNRCNISLRTPKVQLWHGIGFKPIILTNKQFVKNISGIKGFIKYRLQGVTPTYSTFISTSEYFSREFFEASFRPKEIVNLGYPRNDVFLERMSFSQELSDINVDVPVVEKIKKLHLEGAKIILWAPTFRSSKVFELDPQKVDLQAMSDFGEKHNIYFVFKLHPLPKCAIDFSQYSHIIKCNNHSDIYPAFCIIDMLITDYSSICLDYLLLDRPMAFFMYDYEDYQTKYRGLNKEAEDLMPGDICYDQETLEEVIHRNLVEGVDPYADERKRVRDLSWQYQDGSSCERVWNYIENKYLK